MLHLKDRNIKCNSYFLFTHNLLYLLGLADTENDVLKYLKISVSGL